jgi:hypothetical protein
MTRGGSITGKRRPFDSVDGDSMDLDMDIGMDDRMDFKTKSRVYAGERDFCADEFASDSAMDHDQDDSMMELRGILSTLEKGGFGGKRTKASKSFQGISTKKAAISSSKRREMSLFSEDFDGFQEDWGNIDDGDDDSSPQSRSLPKGLRMSMLDEDKSGQYDERESWDSFSLPFLARKKHGHQGMGRGDKKTHHLRTRSDTLDAIQLPSLTRVDQKDKMDKLMDLTEQLYYSQTSQEALERMSDEV